MEYRKTDIKDKPAKRGAKKSGKKKLLLGSMEAIEQSVKFAHKNGLDLTFLKW